VTFALVGEAPNQATINRPSLWLLPHPGSSNTAANRLLLFSGYTEDEFHRVFSLRTNVWLSATGATPITIGRARAVEIIKTVMERKLRGVVLLGSRAAEAFGHRTEPLRFERRGDFQLVLLPHTSGRNVWWNYEKNRRRARTFFEALREEAS